MRVSEVMVVFSDCFIQNKLVHYSTGVFIANRCNSFILKH